MISYPVQQRLPYVEAERFPGVDRDGYGTDDVHAAVSQTTEDGRSSLWDPYAGFEAPRRPE